MKFYKFECKFYTDFDLEDMTAQGMVVASSYTEALEKIECRLRHIIKLSVEEWVADTDFIFCNEEQYSSLNSILDKIENRED